MDELPRIADVRVEPAAVGFMAYRLGDDDRRTEFRRSLSAFVEASVDWIVHHAHRDGAGGWRAAHVVPFLPDDPGRDHP